MDESTLSPSDLFSPSKARQQRAQAQDWAYVESWLSAIYAGRNTPPFERNDETLKALLALAAANERADEERGLMEDLQRVALSEMQDADTPDEDAQILRTITENLTPEGKQSLDALAGLTVALDAPDTDPETLAHHLIALHQTSQTVSQQLSSLETLQAYLSSELTNLCAQLSELQSNPSFTASPNLPHQTADWTRQTKQLRAKLREYEDRLASLPASNFSSSQVNSSTSLARLADEEKALVELRGRVQELEAKVRAFEGLPASKEDARAEVKRLENELNGLRRRRDGLFEGLVEG